jgi:uncharacterized protein (TIGR01655 family)
MRKGIIASSIVIILILLTFGSAYFWYDANYGTQNYYTQITDKGTKILEKDDSNNQHVNYIYQQPIYNRDGQRVDAQFKSNMERPLKLHAYLKIGYNAKRKRVISWEKVAKKDVPKAALNHIHS